MEVRHKLPAIWATVHREAVSAFGETFFPGYLVSPQNETTDKALMLPGKRCQRRDMHLRHNEHMDGRLRVDISESQELLILVDDIRRYLSRNDLAKDAFHETTLPVTALG